MKKIIVFQISFFLFSCVLSASPLEDENLFSKAISDLVADPEPSYKDLLEENNKLILINESLANANDILEYEKVIHTSIVRELKGRLKFYITIYNDLRKEFSSLNTNYSALKENYKILQDVIHDPLMTIQENDFQSIYHHVLEKSNEGLKGKALKAYIKSYLDSYESKLTPEQQNALLDYFNIKK